MSKRQTSSASIFPMQPGSNAKINKQAAQILKQTETDKLKSKTQAIDFFFIVGWMIELILATKDSSVCLSQPLNSTGFTFRIWIWIDAASHLFIWLLLIGLKIRMARFFKNNIKGNMMEIFSFSDIFIIILTIALVFKFIYIFVGIGFFLNSVNFDDCSGNVVQFMSSYFIFFVYVLIEAIQNFIIQSCA